MSQVMVRRPEAGEYADYYSGYVGRVPAEDLLSAVNNQFEASLSLLRSIPEGQATFRYAPEKWSIKQLLGHIIDSERVFGFRAFWFARNAPIPLPGFDQELFMSNVRFDAPSWTDLISHFERLLMATMDLFGSFDDAAWVRKGVANNNEVAVRALGYIVLGHERHHLEILKSRYLGNR